MRNSTNRHLFVGVTSTAAAMAGMAMAGGNSPEIGTDARIAALEQQIAELKAQNGDNWLSDERAEEIRALVKEVVGDAGNRTSLLANGGMAGWNGHPYISNEDGSFKLQLEGQVQTRAVWNLRDNSGDDDSIFGFEIRRAKIGFGGNLFSKDFKYKIKGAFERSGGTFVLEDAYGEYKLNDNMKVKWGQFKGPFLREELTSSSQLLSVDRSYVTELATQNFEQGVQLGYEQDQFRVMAMVNDGWGFDMMGTNSSGSNKSFAGDDTEFGVTARGEFMSGNAGFNQFKDYQSWSDDEFGMLLGGAVHYQKSERDNLTGGAQDTEVDYLAWTVDASLEFGGAHVEGAVVGQHSDTGTPGATDYDQLGFIVSGGVFLTPDQLELFGRWEYYDFDGAVPTGYDSEINLFTVGVNYFWEGHDKKWTTDLVYCNDSIPDGSSGLGIEKDAAGQDGQLVFRSQVQFLF